MPACALCVMRAARALTPRPQQVARLDNLVEKSRKRRKREEAPAPYAPVGLHPPQVVGVSV